MSDKETSLGPYVVVNGERHKTIMDQNGVQRFPENRVIRWLLEQSTNPSRPYGGGLNEIIVKQRGYDHFTEDEVRELYRLIGYSVCGYAECFEDDEIVNPLWEEDE